MKNTGTLRIQAFAARQSSPVEGVTVTVRGNGFTATRLTDAEGNADDVTLTTPACALSLDENNTTQPPYAVCDLVASKTGYRTVRIQGVQVFPGQVTLAQPEMIRRPPRSTLLASSAASDVYKRQAQAQHRPFPGCGTYPPEKRAGKCSPGSLRGCPGRYLQRAARHSAFPAAG